jgi:hypothetical protein
LAACRAAFVRSLIGAGVAGDGAEFLQQLHGPAEIAG